MDEYSEAVGNWLIDDSNKLKVKLRISCLELDYPQSEALYDSIEDFEQCTGRSFMDILNP